MCVVVIIQVRIGNRNYALAVLHRESNGIDG